MLVCVFLGAGVGAGEGGAVRGDHSDPGRLSRDSAIWPHSLAQRPRQRSHRHVGVHETTAGNDRRECERNRARGCLGWES